MARPDRSLLSAGFVIVLPYSVSTLTKALCNRRFLATNLASYQPGSMQARTPCDERADLWSLPDDVLRKIVQALSLRDICSLGLLDERFYVLLSSPLPADGLPAGVTSGSARLVIDSDPKQDNTFNCKEDVTR